MKGNVSVFVATIKAYESRVLVELQADAGHHLVLQTSDHSLVLVDHDVRSDRPARDDPATSLRSHSPTAKSLGGFNYIFCRGQCSDKIALNVSDPYQCSIF